MSQTDKKKVFSKWESWMPATVLVLALTLAATAMAQDYRSFQGQSARGGRATIQPTTGVPETTWNNFGRGFLRWWDPIFDAGEEVDNDTIGQTTASPLANWIDPAPILVNPDIILAGGYLQTVVSDPPYRVAVSDTAASTLANPNPTGTVPYYEWVMGALVAGQDYQVQASLPVGPTNIQPDGNAAPDPNDPHFPARYHLFEVTDANGTQTFLYDMDVDGGAFASLGGELQRFTATPSGQITVRVYATVVRNDFGTPLESTDIPGQSVVYADSVRAVAQTVRDGSYVASPVVGQLVSTPFLGGPILHDQRVVSARNESAFIGALNKNYEIGTVTSFVHNGALAVGADVLRRNMVWSWPAVRPFDLTQGETDRYAADRQAWVLGGPAAAPRYLVFPQVDNLSATATAAGTFAINNTVNHIGPDYYSDTAANVISGTVTWQSDMPLGNYFVEVYLPNDDPAGTTAFSVTYDIMQGATVIDSITINQNSFNGWVRLPTQPTDGYANLAGLPLTVRVSNQSADPSDVTNNRTIYADAVRFVGDADLAIDSTPMAVNANVREGATTALRDVVVVARDNGKIYCMDAHGDITTGDQPEVFWTWPSEDPTTDPNNVATEDFGIATYPTKFGISSMAHGVDTGGNDVLVIASENGRVYCIEMEGRGDGTTRRRWTYPDDFDPTNPNVQLTGSTLGAMTGSVAIEGNQVIIPAENSIISVDLTGTAATKTTTVNWTFTPLPAETISMTPVIAGGAVYFGTREPLLANEGRVYSLDLGTGAQNWMRETRLDGVTQLGAFDTSSPVFLENAFTGLGGDTVYFADGGGFLTAFDAATGVPRFEESVFSGSVVASLSFTHHRLINSFSPIIDDYPIVVAAESSGRLSGFTADGAQFNGTGRVWSYYTEGTDQISSFASGGWPNAAGLLANRSHLYIGDSLGYLYAFASEDDTDGVPPITPGTRPGSRDANNQDNNEAELNNMIEPDDVQLLSPETYRNLLNLSSSTTGLDYADVTAAKADVIERRDFEMGETLYIAVWDIHSPSLGTVPGYYIEVEVEGINSNTRDRTAVVREVTGAPVQEEGGIALIQIPLQPTGSQAVTPGAVRVNAQARTRQIQGTEIALATSPSPPVVTLADISVANPFALGFFNTAWTPMSLVGTTINPTDPSVVGNAPTGNFGAQPKNIWTDGFVGNATIPGWQLATSSGAADPVAHGGSALANMGIYDRSLVSLLSGGRRGLNNVRWHARDMNWQANSDPTTWAVDTDIYLPRVVDPASDLGVFRPLNNGSNKANWLYREFEDYPWTYPNPSLDYPDVRRSTLFVTKEAFGDSQNPLFNGVQLQAPAYTTADFATYETTAGYEAGLTRELQATRFDVNWGVQRFQPPSANGYVGRQTIYVDSGRPGFGTQDAYREFSFGVNVGLDRRLLTGTPTVDLGSMPSGGGFLSNGTNPVPPFDPTSPFRPYNTALTSGNGAQFQRFSVLNDGNTNMLNVRLSKGFSHLDSGNEIVRPLELYAPAEHQLAWTNGGTALYSDLDAAFAPVFRAGVDPTGSVILQKARVGDLVTTKLSPNPFHRANPTLRVGAGWLLDPNVYNPGDPFLGVAVPLGTPTGSYARSIYAFEDLDFTNSSPDSILGQILNTNGVTTWIENEPFTDPGITLKFNVREARLTNWFTAKAAPNIESIAPAGDFAWNNRQPTAVRNNFGDLFMAWSSDRTSGGLPSFIPGIPGLNTVDSSSPWRIYIAGLENSSTGAFDPPLTDLLNFNPVGSNWFGQLTTEIPANGTAAGLFTLAPGDTLETGLGEAGYEFKYPAFPSHGLMNPWGTPRYQTTTFNETHLAFIGEAWKRDSTGARKRVSQLFVALLETNTDGSVNVLAITAMPFDTESIKGRPTVVTRIGGGVDIIYPARANGVTQLFRTTFNALAWTEPVSLGLADSFEDIGNPSVIARPTIGLALPVHNVFFTGKVRGQSNSEAYMGELTPNTVNGQLTVWRPFVNRRDKLEFDSTTSSFWAPGVDWRLDDVDIANFELLVRRYDPGSGNFVFQNLAVAGTQKFDRKTREISFTTILGGQAYVDAKRGSIKFSGAIVPQNSDVYITYSPRFVKLSGAHSSTWVDDGSGGRIVNSTKSTGANYRNASVVYDPRLLGIHTEADPRRANEQRFEDLNYWFDQNGFAPGAIATITHDRFWMVNNRTSGDGGSSSRPYMSSYRFGMQLPSSVATNADGSLVNFVVDFSGSGALAEAPFYQVDPVNGRVYFTAVMDQRPVSVRYTGVDNNGNLIAGNIDIDGTVQIIPEKAEVAMPIEQVANETDVWLMLDPMLTSNTSNRRPPLLWTFWTSGRTSSPDIYFQTLAPKTSPQVPGN